MNPSAADRLGSPNFGRATRMANRGFGGVQGPALRSGDQGLDDLAVDVGQAEAAALI
jgi:hypothetical protein